MIKDGDTYYVFYTGGARGGGGGRGRGRRGGRGGGEPAAAQPAAAEPAAGQPSAAQTTTEQPAATPPTTPMPMGSINMLTSPDMKTWTRAGFALPRLPDWTRDVPNRNSPNDVWAPDISFYNGKYHLYYSVSSFGRQDSAIGLATNKTLDPKSPDYKWEDGGVAIESREGDPISTHRSKPRRRRREQRLAHLGQLLGRHHDAPHRSARPAALRKPIPRSTSWPAAPLAAGTGRRHPAPDRSGTPSKRRSSSSTATFGTCSSRGIYAADVAIARSAITKSPSAARRRSPAPTSTKMGKNMQRRRRHAHLGSGSPTNGTASATTGFYRENGVDYMPFHAYPNVDGRSGRQQLQSPPSSGKTAGRKWPSCHNKRHESSPPDKNGAMGERMSDIKLLRIALVINLAMTVWMAYKAHSVGITTSSELHEFAPSV